MSKMKTIVINDFVKVGHFFFLKYLNAYNTQNYNEIKVSEAPQPQPKNGEVLVKVAAAGVNFVDLLYVSLLSYTTGSFQASKFIHKFIA
jgi:hypothetical protein